MSLYYLRTETKALPQAWHPQVLGHIGEANLKVLRLDERSVIEEVHEYDEGLLVIDGRLELRVGGKKISVTSGQLWHTGNHRPTRNINCFLPSEAHTLNQFNV